MLVRVMATIEEEELNYVIRFSLPPPYPGAEEKKRLRLPIPKRLVTDDCTFFFGRFPSLYPRRIRIVNKKDVYVEKGVAPKAPINGVWKVFIELTPFRFNDC